MDDLLWNGSWSGGRDDNGCEETLFISDLSCCSSPPLKELQTVAEILGLPKNDTSASEMGSMALRKPAGEADLELLCDQENSWPAGASSGELSLEELGNDKELHQRVDLGTFMRTQNRKKQNPILVKQPSSANYNGFQQPSNSSPSRSSSSNDDVELADREASMASARMKALMYHAAAFRPVNLGLEMVEKKRRRNVKTSKEPQTVAARKRREKISEKIRVLQRLVPGGSKMDTASMLDEAASYLKFLRAQIKAMEGLSYKLGSLDCLSNSTSFSFNSTSAFPTSAYFPL